MSVIVIFMVMSSSVDDVVVFTVQPLISNLEVDARAACPRIYSSLSQVICRTAWYMCGLFFSCEWNVNIDAAA